MPTYDNNPNTIMEEYIDELGYSILTSFEDAFEQVSGSERGIGSLRRRSVAARVAMYNPFNWAVDTYIQLMGGFQVVDSEVFEWMQKDAFLPFELKGIENPDDEDTIINNVDGGATNAYAGTSTTGRLQVTEAGAQLLRVGDIIRYSYTEAGEAHWVDAHVDKIEKESNGKWSVTVSAIDSAIIGSASGDTLPAASSVEVEIERKDSVRGSDLNFDPQPRGKQPKTYRSVVQVIVHDDSFTPRSMNVGAYVDFLREKEEDLFMELRRSRETRAVYGKQGKLSLDNNDIVYTAPGVFDIARGSKLYTFDPTEAGSTDFSDKVFEDELIDYIERQWGGESGGPHVRETFINARYAKYLSKAFRDRQRFYANEFVAGVHTMRYDDPNGVSDFVKTPFLDYMAHRPGASVRQADTKALAITVPVNECLTRVMMNGEGPYSEHFIRQGGDRVNYMRSGTTEGLMAVLTEFMSVHEEE